MKKLLMIVFVMFGGASYADTETINWYVDDSVYTATTCEIGGDITLPAAPPKRGYNFTGWLVLVYDFSTLDADIGGSSYTQSAESKTWHVVFSYGTVFGKSLCSQTSGSYAVAGVPDESGDGDTRNCWCKATGYKPAGDNNIYENVSPIMWVFDPARQSASDCASYCASGCANRVMSRLDFRRAIFGITQ